MPSADSKSTYGVTVILADGPVGAESNKSLDYGDWDNVGMKSKGYGPIYPYESKSRL